MPPRTGEPISFYTASTTADWTPYTINNLHLDRSNQVSGNVSWSDDTLDNLARKIYRVFSEHIAIDISEDEFMNLLKEA